MVSILDVASHAGVSPTTVSHALSGHRKVSEALLARVLDAVESLNYTPTRSAQSLAQGKTRILGLIVPDISNSFFAELAEGVEKAAVEGGYNVLLSTTGFNHAREAHALEMVKSRAVDGIIYAAGAPPSTAELKRLSADVPMVLVDEELPGIQVPTFVSDNYLGGQIVATHLGDLGHRSALIMDAGQGLVSSDERVRGFVDRWRTYSNSRAVRTGGGFTYEGGRAAVQSFVTDLESGEITAIFAANDLMALGALEVLLEAQIALPEAVSLVGFDDSSQGYFARPRLTTVQQDVVSMGVAAVHALVDLIEKAADDETEKIETREVLPVSLIVRESSGRVPMLQTTPGSGSGGGDT